MHNPTTRVAAIAAAMLAEEGEYHVKGRYYASAQDAAKARLIEAERDVRIEEGAARRRELLNTRFVLTEAGRAVLAEARRNEALTGALTNLVDDRPCFIDRHGICTTHDQPCTHERGRFECPVAVARETLARRMVS